MLFLRILEDNVYGRYDASKQGSLKMFDNIVINRVGELDNICTKLQIDNAENFWPSRMTSRNSMLGILIHVLRTKFVPKTIPGQTWQRFRRNEREGFL